MEEKIGRSIAVAIFLIVVFISMITITSNLQKFGLMGGPDPLTEGLKEGSVQLNGAKQPYYLYTNDLDTDENRPAILVLQGSGVKALAMRHVGFETIADRENLVVIYLPLRTPSWLLDAALKGEDTDTAFDVDTVNFVHQLFEELIVNEGLDPSRIYLTGFSDGGVATFYFMCELSHLVSAVATVSAAMPRTLIEDCAPERPIPLMMLNGTADSSVRFSGGHFGDPNRPQGLEMASAFDTATFWRQANSCGEVDEKDALDDVDPKDQVRVWTQIWKDCEDGATIHFVTLVGGTHGWPGADLPMPTVSDPDSTLKSATGDFSGADYVWQFFADKALPPSDAAGP